MAVAATISVRMRVNSSWDTQPGATSHPLLKNKNPKKSNLPIPQTPLTTTSTTLTTLKKNLTPSELLNCNNRHPTPGNETWLPLPPKVKNPRSIYNAASLAYIGDCIYEVYARRHFLSPSLSIEEYNNRVMAVVRCEAQDALLKKLLSDDYLSEEERDVLRWGKNIDSGKTRTAKRAGVAVYNRASSLETLVSSCAPMDLLRLSEVMKQKGQAF
ncbi:hypothetical protein HHK36_014294 [Tetracentron sinense]|uniref:RNase III domain-containing protein n=1 Tax=Tetracentron sinense TaxID=13715 RepID=A0A834Z8H6_TETSI|nr:hypothetical protein HHK36_014294 [Tetracentron sinense]